MEFHQELYYGWLIVVVLDGERWIYECHEPEGIEYTSTESYCLKSAAISQAKLYIHQKLIKAALLQVDIDISVTESDSC